MSDPIEEAAAAVLEQDDQEPKLPPPTVQSIGALKTPTPGGPDELLKDRYLCRGGGMLLVGPTGVGKSTFALQAMLQWSMGKPFMDIRPNGRLKSLLIQAENDEGDLAEMRNGVVMNLEFTQKQWDRTTKTVLLGSESCRTGGKFVSEVVEPLIEEYEPDLIWIDPVLAYLGGDANTQTDVGGFLRNSLNPVLQEHKCGAILLHHTNKPKGGADRVEWKGGEQAYLGSGSAEWVNWSRAMLGIQGTESWGLFKLVAAKRGDRLQWTDAVDLIVRQKWMRHSRGSGLHWIEVDEAEAEAIRTTSSGSKVLRELCLEDVKQFVKKGRPMLKKELQQELVKLPGISRNQARDGLEILISHDSVFEYGKKRTGRKPAIYIGISKTPPKGMIRRP